MDTDIQGALNTAHEMRVHKVKTLVRKMCAHLPHEKFPYARAYMAPLQHPSSNWEAVETPEALKTQVLYVLTNLGAWRGETARQCKAELKSLVGIK